MGALSAPSTREEVHILSITILVVSVFSAIGAGWIILSFILFKPLRSFRHQLILGLAISDFWMAANFMSSAIITIRGGNIGDLVEKPFCSFNGFMVQLFVAQTDYWVLAIAIYTYLVLANHTHQSVWIQDHKAIIWVLPWLLSTLWATIGLTVVGYGDIGAWCWFVSDTVRLFVNFIPRWIIIFIILALYTRLYFIIYRSHSRFMSFDEDAAGSLPTSSNPTPRNPPRVHQFAVSSSADKTSGRASGGGGIPVTGRAPSVLKRISHQMLIYPLIYTLLWTTPTAIRIYQSATERPAPFAVGTVDKCCIAIQGLADALVYGVNERMWGVWRRGWGGGWRGGK